MVEDQSPIPGLSREGSLFFYHFHILGLPTWWYTLRWARFLSDEKSGKESPRLSPWEPPGVLGTGAGATHTAAEVLGQPVLLAPLPLMPTK